jgi:hypothetical protein
MSLEVQSERVAAFAWRSWLPRGQSTLCLEVLGDVAGVHATPADIVLVVESLWVVLGQSSARILRIVRCRIQPSGSTTKAADEVAIRVEGAQTSVVDVNKLIV